MIFQFKSDNISKSTFNKIWETSKSWKYPEKTVCKSIGVGTVSNYIEYLKELGIKREFILSMPQYFVLGL